MGFLEGVDPLLPSLCDPFDDDEAATVLAGLRTARAMPARSTTTTTAVPARSTCALGPGRGESPTSQSHHCLTAFVQFFTGRPLPRPERPPPDFPASPWPTPPPRLDWRACACSKYRSWSACR